MTGAELVKRLLAFSDLDARKRFLEENTAFLNDEVVRLLKEQADHFLRADIRRCLEIADIVYSIAQLTNNVLYMAMGNLIEANGRSIGLSQYDQAIKLYDNAAKIYQAEGRIVEQARSQIGKVSSLSHLGLFAEALKAGKWASSILEAHEQWRLLATLTMNLGVLHGRQGEDKESITMFDRACDLYEKIGKEGISQWASIQQNRAVALRNMGQFEASMEASQMSKDGFLELDEKIEAARAQQGLALTYFILGRFNEALELLDRVREIFMADERRRDAILVDLYISNCLLQMRRYPDVIEKCRNVRSLFAELGSHQVEGLAIINEAIAFVELQQYEDALASLSEAHQIFEKAGNVVRMASTDLETSAVLFCQKNYPESLAKAQECAEIFKSHSLPIEEAQALIVAARGALSLKKYHQVHDLLMKALQMGHKLNIPTVRYKGHSLLGALAVARGDIETAQREYELAIQEVEQLRGRLMVEFRVGFLGDKESLYQDMVEMCIDQDQPVRGLEFTERAKSRALLDLLAYRLDLTIQAKDENDIPLVERLTQLRVERDRLYRRWENDAESGAESDERGWSSSQSVRQKAQQEVSALEKQITELWHKLLVHNADYAREAALWAVRTDLPQPYLDKDTLLLEYYAIRGRLVVFLVTNDNVQAIRLGVDSAKIESQMQFLKLNLRNVRSVLKNLPNQMSALKRNAQAHLYQLYQMLIAPIDDRLTEYSKIIIVPHGNLHYLPFHALYDGNSYLIERYVISYLPSASSLRYCREGRSIDNGRSIAVGHSNGGHLPHAVEEARGIADLLNGQALVEEQASLSDIYKLISECQTVHFAAHGDYRPDNPLFSGLALSGGWLTTMDIFNLRLKASLVTLSACQTGRNVVGGGDELLGLMRAFLSAGSASIALTLWSVEDRSTALIMEAFYKNMVAGLEKGGALRHAQLQFIRKKTNLEGVQSENYAHPYFWAPFFLVGDEGPL